MAEMTLSEELQWRGFVHQTTLPDGAALDKQAWTFYHGFDASAPSQAIGNLAAMMFDKVFLRHGHKAVLLAGGATSLIGDPGGKDAERPLQSADAIARNVAGAEAQLKKVFRGYDFKLVNNYDWYKDMNVLDFLRDVGKHFSMTPLVQRDYIATRMGEGAAGISFTEFSYTLLQGYDFLRLHQQLGVNLQLAGSDQWGNGLSGVELVRKVTGQEVHVMTLPLVINKATGKKFGKSEGGAVWLDPAKTTPTQFYQFWINIDDAGVEDYLKIYTELGKADVDDIMAKHRAAPAERWAQKRLAQEVTSTVHGAEEMAVAETVTGILTGKQSVGEASEQVIAAVRQEIATARVAENASLVETLVSSGLAESNSQARQFLADGAVYINGQPATAQNLSAGAFQNGRLLLRKGKMLKNAALIERA